MIHTLFFSATGTTRQTVMELAARMGGDVSQHDITPATTDQITIEEPSDIVIIGMPVYAGRIPSLAAERLRKVHGRGQSAIAVCVYGNRHYDDALVELCDIATAQGFRPIAAGAFIAEHCIFPEVAKSRPDSCDTGKIETFARLCRERLAGDSSFDIRSVKGNRPYRKPGAVPLHPKARRSLCVGCGVCAGECPAGAIDPARPYLTDNDKCISCCRCIKVCPADARKFRGLLYNLAGRKFVKDNSRRREPEWF